MKKVAGADRLVVGAAGMNRTRDPEPGDYISDLIRRLARPKLEALGASGYAFGTPT